MDVDFISVNLKQSCFIGVLPEEKQKKQSLMITVKLYLDLSKAGKSDALSDTIDYAKVAQKIHQISQIRHYDLVESLGEEIASLFLKEYPISAIDVKIEKLGLSRKINATAFIFIKRKPSI